MEVEAERVERAFKNRKHLLTKREIDIVTRFYGINKRVRHTLAEIGEKYHVTRERVRQIKAVSLEKLKVKLNK